MYAIQIDGVAGDNTHRANGDNNMDADAEPQANHNNRTVRMYGACFAPTPPPRMRPAHPTTSTCHATAPMHTIASLGAFLRRSGRRQ